MLLSGDCADEMGAVLGLIAAVGVAVVQVVPAQVEATVHGARGEQPNCTADQRVRTCRNASIIRRKTSMKYNIPVLRQNKKSMKHLRF